MGTPVAVWLGCTEITWLSKQSVTVLGFRASGLMIQGSGFDFGVSGVRWTKGFSFLV